ncbi:MAG: hypothetical protein Q7R93_04095 [bacterium]|nr:hypothetical protein [bacterium]
MPDETPPQSATTPQSPIAAEPKASDDLRRIRTYQSDVEEMMQKEHVSKTEIALAETEKQHEQEAAPPTPAPFVNPPKMFNLSNRLPLGPRWNGRLIALISVGGLVLAGIGVGTYFYLSGSKRPVPTPPVTEVKEVSAVALDGRESRAAAIAAIRKVIDATSVPQNELRTIPLKIGSVSLTTADLFTVLNTSEPATLTRSLAASPTLGVHGFKGGQPFLLFSVTSYDYAFDGMLKWESTLLEDIGPLFGVSQREILQKVGSTTKEALGNTIAIKDTIIRNKDARAAFDPSGAIVFLYSFIDKQTLVLTTNEETLKLLLSKAGGGRLR